MSSLSSRVRTRLATEGRNCIKQESAVKKLKGLCEKCTILTEEKQEDKLPVCEKSPKRHKQN